LTKTHDSYREIGRRIAELGKPTFFVLEGGYMGKQVGHGIDQLLQGYEG
jgi:acetoin utilization deacetylase AcuC-like enzyme